MACNDDDYPYYPVTQQLQQALYALYPAAEDVEWASHRGYLVADFELQQEQAAPTECEAWFTPTAVWLMTEREIGYTALPEAVRTAFESSAYGANIITEVEMLEREDAASIYIITVDEPSEQMLTNIFYTEGGVLIKVRPEYIYDNYSEFLPTAVPSRIANYIKTNYPSATMLSVERQKGATEVDILDGEVVRSLFFDAMNRWGLTRTELQQEALPGVVVLAIDNLFREYRIEDAALIESPSAEYYLIDIESSAGQSTLRISTTGVVL